MDRFNSRGQFAALRGPRARQLLETSQAGRAAISGFVTDNTRLISSIPEQFHDQVARTVEEAVAGGFGAGHLENLLQERFGVAESRARLIANDQTQRLNGRLAEIRQTEAGITHYRWGPTSSDDPRPEHAALEGEIFAWADPPPGGHPGELINCKHIAIPVVSP